MSTYTITTNFANKDSLPSGSSDKVIKGSEFTAEFNNIATAINDNVSKISTNADDIDSLDISLDSKLDKSGGTISGNLTVNGELTLGDALEVQHFSTSKVILTDGDGTSERQGGQIWAAGNNVRYYAYDWNNVLGVYNPGNHYWYNDHPDDSPVSIMSLTSAGLLKVSSLSIANTPLTATATEINHLAGATSNLQDQIDGISTSGLQSQIDTINSSLSSIFSRLDSLEDEVYGGGL